MTLALFMRFFATVGGVLRSIGPQAYRAVAYSDTASISVPTAPVVCTAGGGTDPGFSLAAGVISFDRDCQFTSTVSVLATCASGSPIYYTDAEVSTDGGTTWTRGAFSLRCEQLAAGYQRTREFSFSGRFPAGSKLRFVEWASAAGVTLQTVANNGSTVPARRLTYSRIPAIIV